MWMYWLLWRSALYHQDWMSCIQRLWCQSTTKSWLKCNGMSWRSSKLTMPCRPHWCWHRFISKMQPSQFLANNQSNIMDVFSVINVFGQSHATLSILIMCYPKCWHTSFRMMYKTRSTYGRYACRHHWYCTEDQIHTTRHQWAQAKIRISSALPCSNMYTRPSLACKNNTNLSITSINQSRNYRHTYFWLAKLMFWGMISFCQQGIDVATCTFSRFITCIYPTFHWICYDASFLFNYHWRGIWLEFKKVYTTERQIGYNKTYMEPVMTCTALQ